MKSKFFLTSIAVLLALGLSFANNIKNELRTGYWLNPFTGQVEAITVYCADTPQIIFCTYNGFHVFAEPALINPLFKCLP